MDASIGGKDSNEQIIRELQQNLKDVGQYRGAVTGEWSQQTGEALRRHLLDVKDEAARLGVEGGLDKLLEAQRKVYGGIDENHAASLRGIDAAARVLEERGLLSASENAIAPVFEGTPAPVDSTPAASSEGGPVRLDGDLRDLTGQTAVDEIGIGLETHGVVDALGRGVSGEAKAVLMGAESESGGQWKNPDEWRDPDIQPDPALKIIDDLSAKYGLDREQLDYAVQDIAERIHNKYGTEGTNVNVGVGAYSEAVGTVAAVLVQMDGEVESGMEKKAAIKAAENDLQGAGARIDKPGSLSSGPEAAQQPETDTKPVIPETKPDTFGPGGA